MISSDQFCDELASAGIEVTTGVPCSFFSGPIMRLTEEGTYVAAANEGAALAVAAGAVASGRRAAVMAQNSGFGNLINPLTSLHMTYDIPVLLFMSLRGWPDPATDEPQHAVMGVTTHALLDTLGLKHWTLRRDCEDLQGILQEAMAEYDRGRPVVVLVEKGAVSAAARRPGPDTAATGLSRGDAMKAILPFLADTPVVATTGYTSRELFALADRGSNFYMQGSMGHAASFGLGLALADPGDKPVFVFDGDGAALMHLGALSTVGAVSPAGLVHIIFDNNSYESTGAQPTTAPSTDFAMVGMACGYASATTCSTTQEIEKYLEQALDTPGPHLCVVKVTTGQGEAPPRATSALTAPGIYERFSRSLARKSLC